MKKEPETVFLECPICNFLNEIGSSVISNQITVENVYGAELVRTIEKTEELLLCEQCATAIWPKEYAPKEPKILNQKPKKPRKKRLTTKKKKRIISQELNDKNEHIEKKQSNRKSPRG